MHARRLPLHRLSSSVNERRTIEAAARECQARISFHGKKERRNYERAISYFICTSFRSSSATSARFLCRLLPLSASRRCLPSFAQLHQHTKLRSEREPQTMQRMPPHSER